MAAELVVGVDSSTQSTKVEARRLTDGEVVATGSSPHPQTNPPVSEQNPNSWWSALVDACGQLGDARRDVVAIAVAGQQHGLVLLDAEGRPVRKAKLWNDTTSAPQAAELVAALGAERWAEVVGTVPVAATTIAKLAWVAQHEPDTLARATMAMLPHDYLTMRLCGAHVTDRGDASGTSWFDPVANEMRPELLALAAPGWQGATPTVLGPADPAGALLAEAADALGLPAGIVVGPGTGDNMAAALGLGLGDGQVAVSLGTSGTVFASSATTTRDPSGAVAGFADATGAFLPLVCTLNATKVTDTVARWLGTDAAGIGQLALDAVDDPGSVTLVPYFDGERTPNLPEATGSLVGVTNSTTRNQMALAAHDGVLCGLLDGYDALVAAGATVGAGLVLVGGGNRSVAYRQRLADLSGQTVRIPSFPEAVASGAAVQAAAVRSGRSAQQVAADWALDGGETVSPDRHRRESAVAVRARYADAAAAVRTA